MHADCKHLCAGCWEFYRLLPQELLWNPGKVTTLVCFLISNKGASLLAHIFFKMFLLLSCIQYDSSQNPRKLLLSILANRLFFFKLIIWKEGKSRTANIKLQKNIIKGLITAVIVTCYSFQDSGAGGRRDRVRETWSQTNQLSPGYQHRQLSVRVNTV